MPTLTIIQKGNERTVDFSGTPTLDEVMIREGIRLPHPCGGRGRCGKCAVDAEGSLSAPSARERELGCRLSCVTRLTGDARVTLPDTPTGMRIVSDTAPLEISDPTDGYGVAVDIGTTTVALKVFDLHSGICVGTASAPNPQTTVAADVIGRIEAAMRGEGERLQSMICDTLRALLVEAVPDGAPIVRGTVTGNTTMLYLLTGHDPTPLSRAPFRADRLFGEQTPSPWGRNPVYLPPCMNAFVGADITCAVLAAGMCERTETALLCDIGTNGELALWKDGVLYVTSTAAGPAFEGAGIECGCGSIDGAVDRVRVENGHLSVHTIGECAPVGICGSGVLDAVASGLALDLIDESGAMDDPMPLGGSVALYPRDVRAVQLAKAAVAAGIDTLLEVSHTPLCAIGTLYIAGGFGTHLSMESAVAIGLLPRSLTDRVRVLGNAALRGAAMTLADPSARARLENIAAHATHVSLGGDSRFSTHYINRMILGEDE